MASAKKSAKPRRKTDTSGQLSVRFTPEVISQIDEVLERAGGIGSRVDVVRRATELGLPLLLERIGKP